MSVESCGREPADELELDDELELEDELHDELEDELDDELDDELEAEPNRASCTSIVPALLRCHHAARTSPPGARTRSPSIDSRI